MTNKEIARALSETADLIELTGGNAFRARAMSRAARTIRGLDEPAVERLQSGTLTDIDGIGEGLASQIGELQKRGSFDTRDELLNAVPTGLVDVLRVKGLGTSKVRTLWKELGITSLDELEQAAENNELVKLDGFGKKTQSNVLENVRLQKRYARHRRYRDAIELISPLLEELRGDDAIDRVELAGELRRQLEVVSAIRLVIAGSADRAAELLSHATRPTDDEPQLSSDESMLSGTIDGGFPLKCHFSPSDAFGTEWWRQTGSEDHVTALIDQFGEPDDHSEESGVFDAAGLPEIHPALRENQGELEAAANDSLPRLITTDDLNGTLHNHSTYSDGADSLKKMASSARDLGLSYFGICDHSQSLSVASGLSVEEVDQQQEEIAELNQHFSSENDEPFRIFSGIESDILPDGSLDYPDEVLDAFDFIVASVHSRFNMSKEEGTERLITAISNPYTSILGHATGRLLLVREGYAIDHDAIIDACKKHNVAIELNANPYRLDMDWRHLRKATEAGVLISINPDAHSTSELQHVRWGVSVAQKAWLTPEQCLNAKSLSEFNEWMDAQHAKRP